jgi:hypothetical protein
MGKRLLQSSRCVLASYSLTCLALLLRRKSYKLIMSLWLVM